MRTWAEISLDRLVENYRAIQHRVGGTAQVGAVVKANAYGHGAVPVARRLVEAGAEWLEVSNAAEGCELRSAGIATRILVMGGVLPFERDAIVKNQLTPVAHSLDELRAWDELGVAMNVHLKVDTGMARLGTLEAPQAIAAAIAGLRHVHLEGLLSHFATPDDPAQSELQVARFQEVLSVVRPEIAHFASSHAIVEPLRGSWLGMVRPGIALYDGVMTWKAAVVLVKDLPKGAPVGYNARFHTARETRSAVIAAGYADGLPRALTNKGRVFLNGHYAPIIGAVSMDLTTIDVTDCAEIRIGDEALILGDAVPVEEIAAAAGTITYEIFTGIGNRVQRVYVP